MAEVRVRKVKIRCPQCGAKNDDVQMCRICGLSMPNAAALRSKAGAGGPAFKDNVEHERAAWRDYNEGRTNREARSRRPEQLPSLPPQAWNEPAAGESGPPRGGWPNPTVIGIGLIVAGMVLFGAWSRLVGSDSESASAAQQAIADSQSAAASDTLDWVAVDGGELRFAATLPVVPDRTDTVSPSASGDVTLTMFTATPNPSTTVAVGAYTVQPGATFDLDQAAVGVVEKIGGTTIDRVEGRDAAGNRYVELTLKVAQGDVVVRLLDAGHHSYILESLGADAAQNFQRLLAGFALT